MSPLGTHDLEALLRALRACGSQPDQASFRGTVVQELDRLVASDPVGADQPAVDAIELDLPGCERIRLARRREPFSERERALVELIRPHLEHAARHALARAATARLVSALGAAAGPERGLDPLALRELGLTAREGEVLTHADRGLDTAEMAAEMGVSPRTVQKHLEHAFAKLEVPSRAAALAKLRSAPASPL